MLYSRIRFGLILLFFGLGVLLHIITGLANAWYLYLASILLLITYFLFGNVWMAFYLLKKGNPGEAERILNQIRRPEWLLPDNRAYYHLTKGMIFLQHRALDPGRRHLEKALQIGLRRENDKAMASLNLAHISYVQKQFGDSRLHLDQAKSFASDDLMIKQNITKLEKVLAALQ